MVSFSLQACSMVLTLWARRTLRRVYSFTTPRILADMLLAILPKKYPTRSAMCLLLLPVRWALASSLVLSISSASCTASTISTHLAPRPTLSRRSIGKPLARSMAPLACSSWCCSASSSASSVYSSPVGEPCGLCPATVRHHFRDSLERSTIAPECRSTPQSSQHVWSRYWERSTWAVRRRYVECPMCSSC